MCVCVSHFSGLCEVCIQDLARVAVFAAAAYKQFVFVALQPAYTHNAHICVLIIATVCMCVCVSCVSCSASFPRCLLVNSGIC